MNGTIEKITQASCQKEVPNYKELRNKFLKRKLGVNSEGREEFAKLSFEAYKSMFESEETFNLQLKLMEISETDILKGFCLIENILQPNLLQELQTIFPEFSELSQSIPLAGPNNSEISVNVPGKTIIKSLSENDPSTPFNWPVFKIFRRTKVFKTIIMPKGGMQHPCNVPWDLTTKDLKNIIFGEIKKDFYDNLFTHQKKNYSSLVSSELYTGGVTADAKVDCIENKIITFQDLDNLIKKSIEIYKSLILNELIICMHPDTLQLLEKSCAEHCNQSQTPLVYDTKKKVYQGVKIYTSPEYLYKPEISGEFSPKSCPAIIFCKQSLVAYGLDFVIKDDINEDQRHARTSGWIRLADPMVYTRFLLTKN